MSNFVIPMKSFQVIIYLLLFSTLCLAQRPTSGGRIPSGGGRNNPVPQGDFKEENADTATVYYLYADNPDERIRFVDTLLNNYFEQYDPARQGDLDYGHLGTLGSAARPLIYTPNFHQGIEVGFNQFDLYRKNAKFKFYEVNNAYTDISYSQGAEQNDGYFKLSFARNFKGGVSLSLHHQRIAHLASEMSIQQNGSYLPLRARYSIFGVGLWIRPKESKYEGFFSYSTDVMQHADNGGITSADETQLLLGSPIDFTLNTHLSEASTRHAFNEVAYQQYYRLAAQKDSTGTTKRALNFSHKIGLKNSIYKYSDDAGAISTVVYENFPIDDRGMRHYIEMRSLDNHFSLGTNRNTTKGGGDLLEVGLRHSLHWLNQEPVDSVLNNLYLTAKINFSLRDRLQLRTYGHYGILANGGDYRLNGTLLVDLAKAGKLEVEAVSQRYAPSLIQKQIFINQSEVWKNDFKKPLENSISGTYSLPKFPASVTARINVLDNYIYSDTLGYFKQSDSPISIFQIIGKANFSFWKFQLNNVLTLQQTTSNLIQLPQIYSKHSLFFESMLFKRAMRLKLGFDVRFNTPYFANDYQPLTGQFFLQTEKQTNFYPATDVFLSFKITRSSFKFFARLDNMNGWITNDYYYQTLRYIIPDRTFRLGFNWRFLN